MQGYLIKCTDCNGTGVCPRCKGTGEAVHDCYKTRKLKRLIDIYGCTKYGFMGSYNRLGIYRCTVCNQLLMVRTQFDSGSGGSELWLRPGQSYERFDFPEEEAEMVTLILNARSIGELPAGLVSGLSYIREFAEERFEELQSGRVLELA